MLTTVRWKKGMPSKYSSLPSSSMMSFVYIFLFPYWSASLSRPRLPLDRLCDVTRLVAASHWLLISIVRCLHSSLIISVILNRIYRRRKPSNTCQTLRDWGKIGLATFYWYFSQWISYVLWSTYTDSCHSNFPLNYSAFYCTSAILGTNIFLLIDKRGRLSSNKNILKKIFRCQCMMIYDDVWCFKVDIM